MVPPLPYETGQIGPLHNPNLKSENAPPPRSLTAGKVPNISLVAPCKPVGLVAHPPQESPADPAFMPLEDKNVLVAGEKPAK